MFKTTAIVVSLVFTASDCYAENDTFSTHAVTRFDGSQIQYHLQHRDHRQKQPIMLFLQGSDCNSIKRHPGLEGYLKMAPKHAVLMVEKYGITDDLALSENEARVDCPNDYLKNNTLTQRVLDAMQVVAHLRRTASWWDGRLLVVGGSSGTMVASQVAAITPETTQLVIFGFGSRHFKQDLLHSISASMASAGLPENIAGAELTKIEKQFETMCENPTPVLFASGHSFAYWATMINFDQYETLAQVSVPILAVQGARDQNVSPQGAKDLIETLKERTKTRLDFFEYPELDHGFQNQTGASEKMRVVSDIALWIENRN